MSRIEAIFQHKSNGELFDAMKLPSGVKFSDDLVEGICIGIRANKIAYYKRIRDRLIYSFSNDSTIDEMVADAERELSTLNADELRIAANHNWDTSEYGN